MEETPKTPEFLRLQDQARRSRISQFLTQQQIKDLESRITSLEREELLRLILKDKSFFKRSIIDVYILMACIRKYQFFDSILQGKGERALQEFCKHLYYTRLEKGRYLYEIGEVADKFYILMTGSVLVQVSYKEEVVTENGEIKVEQRMKEAMRYVQGEMFGETISKQSLARRAASILTETDCQFFQVKKKDYETVNKYMTISLMREKYMFFEQIDIFSRLSKTNLEMMLYLTAPREVRIGHVVYHENQCLDEIYIVKEGEFKLETTICGKENDLNALMKLKARTMINSRKFQTAIVGSKFVLGEIDALTNNRTKESCTCITEKAEIYVIKKKDLMIHLIDDPFVQKQISSKHSLRDERLRTLNRTFNQNDSIKNTFAYRRDHFGQHKHSRSYDDSQQSQSEIQEHGRNFIIKRSPFKSHSISVSHHKRSLTEVYDSGPGKYVSELSRISEIIRQKKRYSKIRKNNDEPLFKFSNEIPVFLRVKMGVTHNTLKFEEGKNQSSKTLTGFPSSSKVPKVSRPPRNIPKKEPKLSANSKTIYGKFFQLLLDV